MEVLRVWLRDTSFDFFLPGWWLVQGAVLGMAFYLGHRWRTVHYPVPSQVRRGHLRRVK